MKTRHLREFHVSLNNYAAHTFFHSFPARSSISRFLFVKNFLHTHNLIRRKKFSLLQKNGILRKFFIALNNFIGPQYFSYILMTLARILFFIRLDNISLSPEGNPFV